MFTHCINHHVWLVSSYLQYIYWAVRKTIPHFVLAPQTTVRLESLLLTLPYLLPHGPPSMPSLLTPTLSTTDLASQGQISWQPASTVAPSQSIQCQDRLGMLWDSCEESSPDKVVSCCHPTLPLENPSCWHAWTRGEPFLLACMDERRTPSVGEWTRPLSSSFRAFWTIPMWFHHNCPLVTLWKHTPNVTTDPHYPPWQGPHRLSA